MLARPGLGLLLLVGRPAVCWIHDPAPDRRLWAVFPFEHMSRVLLSHWQITVGEQELLSGQQKRLSAVQST